MAIRYLTKFMYFLGLTFLITGMLLTAVSFPALADEVQPGVEEEPVSEQVEQPAGTHATHGFEVSSVGMAAQFTYIGSGAFSYAWNFGDGSTSNEQNPQHVYAGPGDYTVTLTLIETEGGEPQNIIKVVTVEDFIIPPMLCSFEMVHDGGENPTVPLNVTFVNHSENVDQYSWTFGDGVGSSLSDPTHIYSNPGSYDIFLICTRGTETLQASGNIVISPVTSSLTASFISTQVTPEDLFTFAFDATASSEGQITGYTWDFGDGATSDLEDPTHTYAAPGTYYVHLTVTDDQGYTEHAFGSVEIYLGASAPVTAFSVTPQQGNAPLTISISNLTTGPVTVWNWDFGDGYTLVTNENLGTLNHTYSIPGTYTIQLNAEGPGGTSYAYKQVVATLDDQPVQAQFSHTLIGTYGETGQQICFTDTSTGPVTTRQWDLASAGNSSEINPCVTFTAGTYVISLSVTGASGQISTASKQISVAASVPPPVANFNSSHSSREINQNFTFTDTSTGHITSWEWDFGDGSNSTEQYPVKSYVASDTYVVTLTVSGPGGSSSKQMTVSATTPTLPNPSCSITINPSTIRAGDTVTLTGSIKDIPTGLSVSNWLWTVNNPSITLSGQTATFTAVANFSAGLTIALQDDSGQWVRDVTCSKNGTVRAVDYAALTCSRSTSNPVINQSVTFTGNSDLPTGWSATSWGWQEHDSITNKASYAFDSSGAKTRVVTMTASNGTESKTLTANCSVTVRAPTLTCSATPNDPSVGQSVSFNANPAYLPSSVTVSAYAWDFNSEGSANVKSPTFIYEISGSKTNTVTVTLSDMSTLSAQCDATVWDEQALSVEVSPSNGLTPYVAEFKAIGGPRSFNSYEWTMPDGSKAFGQTVYFLIQETGQHWASVKGNWKYGTLNASGMAEGYAETDIRAAFTPSRWGGLSPMEVCFTDDSLSGTPISSWVWDLGNGETSSEQNPCTSYTEEGEYKITLTINNEAGLTASASNKVKVYTVSEGGYSFGYDPSSTTTICFNVVVNPGEEVIMWDFGDGTIIYLETGDDANVCHTYSQGGNYTVVMVVKGEQGESAVSRIITVSEPVLEGGLLVLDPFCYQEAGVWKAYWEVGNTSEVDLDFAWQLNGGDLSANTAPAKDKLWLGNFNLGTNTVAIYWGKEQVETLTAEILLSDCVSPTPPPPVPPVPPTNVLPVPVTALQPSPNFEGAVLIPVTGMDHGVEMDLGFFKSLMLYLSIAFLGAALVIDNLQKPTR